MEIDKYIVEKESPDAWYKLSIEMIFALNTIPPKTFELYTIENIAELSHNDFGDTINEYVLSLHESGWHRYTPTLTQIKTIL